MCVTLASLPPLLIDAASPRLQLGQMLGPVLGALLVARTGFAWACTLLSGLLAVVALLGGAALLPRRTRAGDGAECAQL